MANFKRTNTKISLLEDYYNHFDEDHRLLTRHGNVEFVTTMSKLEEYLNKEMKIIELGAGTGRYSISLFNKGYNITAFELVNKNIETLKKNCPKIKAIQGNALDLSMFEDESFDVVLNFGPMYHLLNSEDKIKCLKESKRICKKGGYIFTSYYMNDYAIMKYGFLEGHIIESVENGMVDDSFHVVNKDNDLYSMVTINDIDSFDEKLNLTRVEIISQDGLANFFRRELNAMDEKTYQLFIDYHLKTAKEKTLLGYSAHLLDIVKK